MCECGNCECTRRAWQRMRDDDDMLPQPNRAAKTELCYGVKASIRDSNSKRTHFFLKWLKEFNNTEWKYE